MADDDNKINLPVFDGADGLSGMGALFAPQPNQTSPKPGLLGLRPAVGQPQTKRSIASSQTSTPKDSAVDHLDHAREFGETLSHQRKKLPEAFNESLNIYPGAARLADAYDSWHAQEAKLQSVHGHKEETSALRDIDQSEAELVKAYDKVAEAPAAAAASAPTTTPPAAAKPAPKPGRVQHEKPHGRRMHRHALKSHTPLNLHPAVDNARTPVTGPTAATPPAHAAPGNPLSAAVNFIGDGLKKGAETLNQTFNSPAGQKPREEALWRRPMGNGLGGGVP